MKLIIGLGNIGSHFDRTRHNTGFIMLDALAAREGWEWQTKDKFKALVAEGALDGQKIILAKPTTFYNLAGEAVRAIKEFYKLSNQDILVIHDELALPFGMVRSRQEGSDAGNNGIKSIIAHAGTDIARIRVGIANDHLPNYEAADFVLSPFSHDERLRLTAIAKNVYELVQAFAGGSFTATTLK